MNRILLFPLLLSGLAGLPVHGQVVARGLLQPGPLVSICMDGATHVLACSNLRIRPGTFDLKPFEGKWVRVAGALTQFTPSCIRLALAAIKESSDHVDAAGTWVPGGAIQFTVFGPPGNLQFLFFSAGNARLTPLGAFGTFFLDPGLFFGGGFGPIGAGGTWQGALPIPNDPVFAGLNLVFQPALVASQPRLQALLLNAACVTGK